MKFLVLFVNILIFVTTAAAQSGTTGGALTLDAGVKAHEGIDAIYTKFSRGYRELDPKMVVDLYTDTAVYLTPESGIDRGRVHISQTFESFFSSIKQRGSKMSISFQIVERKVSGDLGYDIGIFSLTVAQADGNTQTSKGKFVVIAVKQGNAWKFQLDSYSDLPKPKNG